VARAYLEHSLSGQGRIHRLWYMGPMFRYGRPQKGRFRQFHQIGAEIIGTAAPGADVEMIALFVDVFEAWGFSGLTVAVNSLGTSATRRDYGEALRKWLQPVEMDLSQDSRQRLVQNPLRVLDSKDARDQALLRGEGWPSKAPPMPRMLDVLDSESRAHWEAVLAGLAAAGIAYEVDHGLVRGLDYYTRTAFEVHDRSLGAQSALGGGGRYDGLIEALGGPPTPGVGFSIGVDRAMLVLAERGAPLPPVPGAVFVVAMESTAAEAQKLVRELRRAVAAETDLEARGLGAQMKAAGKSGARFAVILGEDEAKRGEVLVKDLESGEQLAVPRAGLERELRRRLGREEGVAPRA
jgi:histidyl-tRNA synthetase